MYDYTQNPDYPTTLTGTFAQYTTQGQMQMNNGFYYGGYGNGIVDMGARRMDGMVQQNPVYPQNPYGYPQTNPMTQPVQQPIPTGVGQMLNVQEQGVQPFSSYPPSGPNTQQPGFNSLMTDARRADACAAQVTGNNPWATNATPAPQPVMAQPQMVQQNQMYAQPNMYYPQAQTPNGVFSAAPQVGSNPFEKKPGVNMWDNMYVQPQPYVSPAPNSQLQWQTQQPPQQVQQPMNYPAPQPAPSPYSYQAPPVQNPQNIPWTELSKRSFG